MKNRFFFLIIPVIYFQHPLNCEAQLIDNRVSLYAECVTGLFHGKAVPIENNFIYPSLYSNLKNINGLSIKLVNKYSQYLSFGLGTSFIYAFNWDYKDKTEYKNSEIKLQAIFPSVQFHSRFSELGFFNHGKIYIDISPIVGFSGLKLKDPPFDIQSSYDTILLPENSVNFFYGIKEDVGFVWAFSQSVGVVILYSFQYCFVSSILYNDNHFAISQFNLGLVLKLKKDKRFIYR
jgi:hypothetical protein